MKNRLIAGFFIELEPHLSGFAWCDLFQSENIKRGATITLLTNRNALCQNKSRKWRGHSPFICISRRDKV